MAPEEQFDRAFASALADRQALVQFLEGVSETQAKWQPPDGEWSILQGLEHVMLTETFVRTNLSNAISKAEAAQDWNTEPENPTKMTPEALRRREQGQVLAPDVLEPQGQREFQGMTQELIADRETSREAFIQYRSTDLSRLVLSHPVYGDRNLYDIIEYSGIHDYLHCEQMQRVTRSPNYPSA